MLGLPAKTLRRWLGKPDGRQKMVRGKPVGTWSLALLALLLPAEIFAQLVAMRDAAGCRSIAHLAATQQPNFRPRVAVPSLAPHEQRDAEFRCDVLRPILQRRGDRPLAELARQARDSAVRLNATASRRDRTWLEWIKTVLARDGGRNRFDALELYVSENPASALDGKPRRETVPDLGEVLEPMAKHLPRMWHVAFLQFEGEIAAGIAAAVARDAFIAQLIQHDPQLAKLTRVLARQHWTRRFQRWTAGGRTERALKRRKGSGAKPKYVLTIEESRALRWLRLQKGSFALAIEVFRSHPQCLPATRKLICDELDRAAHERCAPSWPLSLRRAGEVSPEEEASFRGKKHFADVEHCTRRGLFYIDEAGVQQPLAANIVWESDDMSSNEPFTWLDPETGEVRIGRQTLCSIDVYSNFWLGTSPIGRVRDAYRVEDIADHMRELVIAHGLPLAWRLERGVWENNFIHGCKVGTDRDGHEERWGGLDALFTVVHAWTSRGKGTIEGAFKFLQDIMAHAGTSIGRTRGEMEENSRAFVRAVAGDERAARKFWDITTFADAFRAGMERFNQRPKKRRAFGRKPVVPADLYQDAARRDCPQDQLWRFCPVKRPATVRKGHIEVSVNHYPLPFRFAVNGVKDGLYIEHGYPVLIAFHPGHPEQGCHVFNGERGARNRRGLEFGEPMLLAPLAHDAPQVDLRGDARTAHARPGHNAAVRSEFRALKKAGEVAKQSSTIRDGWGNSARRDNSGGTPETVTHEAQDFRKEGDKLITAGLTQHRHANATREHDEEAELARIAKLERKAIERGDLLPS